MLSLRKQLFPTLVSVSAPPDPSWGNMLTDARELIVNAPWAAVFPGLAIFLTVLGLNLFGDGLRDWLDPHMRTRKV